jgi:dihydrofolate reductase
MRKLIAGLNMTLDGYCDHTAGIADDELHEHYSDVLRNADTLIYGRITYQLMESYWPLVVKDPTGNESTDDFAVVIDDISKIVYSRTLKDVTWKNSTLKNEIIKDEIIALKNQPGKNILVGSPSMIVAFANLGLVDEFQIGLQPIILGGGLPLFKNIRERIDLTFLHAKTFASGVMILYYAPGPSRVAKEE